MAVIVKSGERNGVRANSGEAQSVVSDDGPVTTFSQSYTVQCSPGEEAEAAKEAPGIPALRDVFVSGATSTVARVERKRAQEIGDRLYLVTIEGSSLVAEDPDQDDPPESRQPQWSWGHTTIPVVVHKDAIDGRAITNSVGEPFFPTVPLPIPVLRIRRHKLTFDPDEITANVGRVHKGDQPFWGSGDRQALMVSISDDEDEIAGQKYRLVQYEIHFAVVDPLDTWNYQPLDHGTRHLPNANPGGVYGTDFTDDDLVPAVDSFKTPTTTNLDLRGKRQVDTGGGPYFFDGANAYRLHQEADFNLLDLGPW